ncbi:MAG: hypothetical protein WA066_02780 [Candidatus Omnitrophota bacterium]
MTLTKAFAMIKTSQLKNGDIIKWQGYKSNGEPDGGFLYIVEDGKIVGKQVRTARNRKEAIFEYRKEIK